MQSILKNNKELAFQNGSEKIKISSICDLKQDVFTVRETIFLISSKKLFLDFIEKYDNLLEEKLKTTLNVCVFEKKIFQKIEKKFAEKMSKLKKIFAGIYTSEDMDRTIILLSKYFYDRKMGNINVQVDGRKMGTCDIDPTATIAEGVFIGENVSISENVVLHPGVVIMPNVSILKDTQIFSNVTIYSFSKIARNCRIHAGTVIGADGFGYKFVDGQHQKIWHLGGVVIGDNVEIGSNSCVDMGTFSPTIISSGCKIDNQVQVGHNVFIDENCILCGQVAMAGSSSIGKGCILAGRVGVINGIALGDYCTVAVGSIVTNNVPKNSSIAGYPSQPMNEWLRSTARLRQLSSKPSSKNSPKSNF